jgi:hypothetical protein
VLELELGKPEIRRRFTSLPKSPVTPVAFIGKYSTSAALHLHAVQCGIASVVARFFNSNVEGGHGLIDGTTVAMRQLVPSM